MVFVAGQHEFGHSKLRSPASRERQQIAFARPNRLSRQVFHHNRIARLQPALHRLGHVELPACSVNRFGYDDDVGVDKLSLIQHHGIGGERRQRRQGDNPDQREAN